MENRVEIDTRAPFQSVKEAILLFGERVLAGEIYANKTKEAPKLTLKGSSKEGGNVSSSRLASVAAELEHTKRKLKESREESQAMSECLNSLMEELEETKKQLESLKTSESQDHQPELEETEITDIKFVEETKQDVKEIDENRKKYVTFANPPTIVRVMSSDVHSFPSSDVHSFPLNNEEVRDMRSVMKKKNKKKKKPLIPLIGGIFSRKKGLENSSYPIN